MADNSLPETTKQIIDRRTADLKDRAGLSAPNGQIQPMVRIVAQNIFDDQPKLKAQYLKQNGFELNPKNDNQYRPVGSNSDWGDLDPGIKSAYNKGGLSGLISELKSKGENSAFNAIVAGPATAAGGAAGALFSGPIGTILGGAAGSTAARMLKTAIGETLLDEKIAPDVKPFVIGGLVDGVSNQVIGAAGKKGGEWVSSLINQRRDALANAMEATGNNLTQGLVKKVVQNPENFSQENVKGSTQTISRIYHEIFGIDPTTVNRPDKLTTGVLADKMRPLNEQASAEVSKLAANPQANVSIEELTAPLRQKVEDLTAQTGKSVEDKAAISYLTDKIHELSDSGKKSLSFADARGVLDSLQDDAFNYEVKGRSAISQAIGGGEGGLRQVLDQKAAGAGSQLPQINAQRSQMLDTFKNVAQELSPTNIQSAFVGQDTLKKDAVRAAAQEMDQVFGTKVGDSIETGGMQKMVENLYQNRGPYNKSVTGLAPVDTALDVAKGVRGVANTVAGATPEASQAPLDLIKRSQQAKDFANYMTAPASAAATVGKAEAAQVIAQPIKEDLNNEQAAQGNKPVNDLDSVLLKGVGNSSVQEANPVNNNDLDSKLLRGVSQ